MAKNDIHDFEMNAPVPMRRVARIDRLPDRRRRSSELRGLCDGSTRRYSTPRRRRTSSPSSPYRLRSGLHIECPTEEEVKKDYARSKATPREERQAHQGLVRETGHLQVPELGTAFHVHVGMGDIDVVFDKSNPMQLYGLLKDEETWKTKVFLIHGGYPFSQEAAFYANALKNVYVDLSEMIPFASIPGATEKTQCSPRPRPPDADRLRLGRGDDPRGALGRGEDWPAGAGGRVSGTSSRGEASTTRTRPTRPRR